MNKLVGVDISGWDEGINTRSLTADFVIVKVTEGVQGVIYNPTYYQMADTALNSGKLIGFYHYANGGDPIDEADSFYSYIKNYKGRAIACLDWEGDGNNKFLSGLDVSWCKTFLDRIADKFGGTPLLYTSKGVCLTYDWSEVSKKYPLWGAEYADTDTHVGYELEPWQSSDPWGSWGKYPLIHQWGYVIPTPNSGGDNLVLDGDLFYGDANDWKKLCGVKKEDKLDMNLRQQVLDFAYSQLGVRYYSMHEGPRGSAVEGWGCAMFNAWCLNQVLGTGYYGSVYNFAGDALGQGVNQGGGEFEFTDDPQPGDSVIYAPAGYTCTDYDDFGHIAIYVGDDLVIGAMGRGVPGASNYINIGISETSIEEQSLGGRYRFIRCKRLDQNAQDDKIYGYSSKLYNSNNTVMQYFRIVPIPDSEYVQLLHVGRDMNLDVKDGLNENNTPVRVWEKNTANAQQWKLIPVKTKFGTQYELEPKCAPGMRLDAKNGGTKPYTGLWIHKANNTIAQRWIFVDSEDGNIRILSAKSGLAIDAGKGVQ